LDNSEIVTKFRHNAALWTGPNGIGAIEAATLGLDDAPNAADALSTLGG